MSQRAGVLKHTGQHTEQSIYLLKTNHQFARQMLYINFKFSLFVFEQKNRIKLSTQ